MLRLRFGLSIGACLGLLGFAGCYAGTNADSGCADTVCDGAESSSGASATAPDTASATAAAESSTSSAPLETSGTDSSAGSSEGSAGDVCGDGTCDPRETCSECASDCGECPPACGDGTCDPDETCDTCSDDCGACMPDCGNGICDGGDHCSTCAEDCGVCALPEPTPIRGPYLQNGNPLGVTVRWRTSEATDSAVVYGPAANNLLYVVVDPELTTEHEIVIDNLEPDTNYLYRIASTDSESLGGDGYAFDTLPTPGAETGPVRVWLLGDAGNSGSNLDHVRDSYYAFSKDKDTDIWILLGDNAYTDGTDDEYQDAVFDVYTEYLRDHVLWSTIGNHERVDSGGAYFDIFTLPTAGEAGGIPSGTENWYSFDYGDIHFVCLDSDTSSQSEMMTTWLTNDLAANERTWLVAYWHHPPYTKGSHNSDAEGQLINMRENFVPLLESYGVDLVLTGHSHSYERTYLIEGHTGISDTFDKSMTVDGGDGREDGDGSYTKAQTDAPGTVYVVAGSSAQTSPMEPDRHEAMFISLQELGSMVLDIEGNRLDATFLGDDGSTRDYFTMIKN